MSKVILYVAVSEDGFIAEADGGVGWLDQYDGIEYDYSEFMERIGALIMGSTTYEQVVSFGEWPYKGHKSYIMTNRELKRANGADLEFVSRDPDEAITRAQESAGEKDIWLVGGAKVAQAFLEKDLIDEVELFVMPTVLGSGIALWKDEHALDNFVLVDTKQYQKGVEMKRYTKK